MLVFLHLSLAHDSLVVVLSARHEIDELLTDLFFVLRTDGELIANGLFLSFDLGNSFFIELFKSFFLLLGTLTLDFEDLLTLRSVVVFFEGLLEHRCLPSLVLLDEVFSLLFVLAIDTFFSFFRLLLDFRSMLLFKQLAATIKTLLQHSVELLLLPTLVSVDQAGQVRHVLIMVL